jgi:hypothetical protein
MAMLLSLYHGIALMSCFSTPHLELLSHFRAVSLANTGADSIAHPLSIRYVPACNELGIWIMDTSHQQDHSFGLEIQHHAASVHYCQ